MTGPRVRWARLVLAFPVHSGVAPASPVGPRADRAAPEPVTAAQVAALPVPATAELLVAAEPATAAARVAVPEVPEPVRPLVAPVVAPAEEVALAVPAVPSAEAAVSPRAASRSDRSGRSSITSPLRR